MEWDRLISARFIAAARRDGSPARYYADDDQIQGYLRLDIPLLEAARSILQAAAYGMSERPLRLAGIADTDYVTLTIDFAHADGVLVEAELHETRGLGRAYVTDPVVAPSDGTDRSVVAALAIAWHAERLARLGVPVDVERWVATAAVRTRHPWAEVTSVPTSRSGEGMIWDCPMGPEEFRAHGGRDTHFTLDLIRRGLAYEDLSFQLLDIGGRLEAQGARGGFEDEALTAKAKKLALNECLVPLHAEAAGLAHDVLIAWRGRSEAER